VAIRELRGDQLFVVRKSDGNHSVTVVGSDDAIQGTIRLYPEALLAPSVIVCEGASEVGLLRGMDIFHADRGEPTLTAAGIGWVDANGVSKIYGRAKAFQSLGYRVAVLRDDDVQPDPADEATFIDGGGAVFKWRAGYTLEDELFCSLSVQAVFQLLGRAVALLDESLVDDHIRSASSGELTYAACASYPTVNIRKTLGAAARSKRGAWYKSVSKMEDVARDIVFPDLQTADAVFRANIESLEQWMFRGA